MKHRILPLLVASILALGAAASAQNLLQNGGFATDLSGWNVSDSDLANAVWSPLDADGSAGSGSALVTDTSASSGSLDTPLGQCLSVLAGSSYVLTSKFYFPAGQSTNGWGETEIFWLSADSTDACSGGYIQGDAVLVKSTDVAAGVWTTATKTVTAPAGAVRVAINSGADRIDASGTLAVNIDDVSFTRAAGPAGELVGILAGVGSLRGLGGANFKTAVQASNWGALAVDVRFVYHPAGHSASPGDPEISTHVDAGATVSTDDIVAALGQSGLGSIDVYSASWPAPLVIARIYADGGDAGTTGFVEGMVDPSTVPGGPGIQVAGVLVGPSDIARFRYHVGIRTLGKPVSLSIVVRDSAGQVVHSSNADYPAEYFVQQTVGDFLGGFDLAGDDSISIMISGGGAIIYGATTDNVTNDPSVQLLPYLGLLS